MNTKLCTLLCGAVLFVAASGQTQSAPEGGVTLTMSHSVVAGGGGYSQWTQPDLQSGPGALIPNFEIQGTIGQGIAGTTSTAGPYGVHGGFWLRDIPLQPTAGRASITGRINNLGGANRRVRVVLTNLSTGERLIAAVNGLGYYTFDEVEVAHIYMLRAVGKGIVFEPENLTLRLLDNVSGVDFTAIPIE